MMNEWKTCLLDHAAEWDLPRSGQWNSLLYNNYHPHISSMSVFWFHGRERYPQVVTKIFLAPEIPVREFANLEHLHHAACDLAPRPLHVGQRGKFWTLWMKGVPGVRLERSNRGYAPAVLESITDMVTRMHQAVRREHAAPDRYREAVARPLDTISAFGRSAAVRDTFCASVSAIPKQWLASLPSIPQHGDLYSGHLLAHGGRWRVLDWESFGAVDLPFYDLCTLLLSMLWENGNTPASWDRTLLQQIPRLAARYTTQIGLNREDLSRLLPLTLINWFHLQWTDGRMEFCHRLYETIADYAVDIPGWEERFLGE